MLKTASADDTLNPTREDFGCRQPRVAGAGQTVILGAPQPRFRGHWLSQENGAAPPAASAPAGCAHGVGPWLSDAPFRRACLRLWTFLPETGKEQGSSRSLSAPPAELSSARFNSVREQLPVLSRQHVRHVLQFLPAQWERSSPMLQMGKLRLEGARAICLVNCRTGI